MLRVLKSWLDALEQKGREGTSPQRSCARDALALGQELTLRNIDPGLVFSAEHAKVFGSWLLQEPFRRGHADFIIMLAHGDSAEPHLSVLDSAEILKTLRDQFLQSADPWFLRRLLAALQMSTHLDDATLNRYFKQLPGKGPHPVFSAIHLLNTFAGNPRIASGSVDNIFQWAFGQTLHVPFLRSPEKGYFTDRMVFFPLMAAALKWPAGRKAAEPLLPLVIRAPDSQEKKTFYARLTEAAEARDPVLSVMARHWKSILTDRPVPDLSSLQAVARARDALGRAVERHSRM
ncbi:MAG: hypothetical protein M3O22_00745 [Pseudomonadota bacterium]|nr:hypothetical protein [Pseudomonadota bacterium]